jgi:hypothetical protein
VDKSVGESRGIGARALLQEGFVDLPQIWAACGDFAILLNFNGKFPLLLPPE